MPKQKINFLNPKTGKRQIGCLDVQTGDVHNVDNEHFELKNLQKKNQDGGIGFFETCVLGKVIQKAGRFLF